MRDYLKNPSKYIQSTTPIESLYVENRDTNILTSAQFCVLPLHEGSCEFNVHLYNYQSYEEEPGVLVLVVSQQGTSAQILSGTTPLYFNNNGKACNFIAERLEDVRNNEGNITSDNGKKGKMSEEEQERNVLFIYQIPLIIKKTINVYPEVLYCINTTSQCEDKYVIYEDCNSSRGMDEGILKAGDSHSEFLGVKNKSIVRDPQYPIRCTVQFYKVTDSQEVPENIFKRNE